ncbi:MAG: hypothetical protein HY701_08600 [Gemmatimonadetes bacterium]|nr:hypothetical protein [Gemmatimonadota bacterium]
MCVFRWTTEAYDRLERAVADQARVSLRRRGTEYVVIAVELVVKNRRETLIATHPTTGENLAFVLEELETFEVL